MTVRLLVISHTPHYRRGDGYVGWGPTVREIDRLTCLFEEVVHVAPLHSEPAPASALPYESGRVRLRAVRPAGGARWLDKLDVLWRAPSCVQVIRDEMRVADAVHIRAPAAISLMALGLLPITRRPRLCWVKYAGSWAPDDARPWSYALQRWWVARGLHRGVVTVNGRWPGQPAHVHSLHNPCLGQRELEEGRRAAEMKAGETPSRLIFVGRIERAKGFDHVLAILAELRGRGYAFTLDAVGEGPAMDEYTAAARRLGVHELITFHGWLPRPAIAALYASAHVQLLPSLNEGWPKVLSEGMAYGVVPVASEVGSVAQVLRELGVGRAIRVGDVAEFASATASYVEDPQRWREESLSAVSAAAHFTYERYVTAVGEMLDTERLRIQRAPSGARGRS